jgi:glycosyltransferase involved in cell wall biosynthesis
MKIVQVNHGFPPHNIGGAEIYTHSLSRELAKQDDVFVFYRIADPGRPDYETQLRKDDGLTFITVNNTLKDCDSFEDTYRNDSIARIFTAFLEEFEPDIVHFQHLLWLSTTLIEEAYKKHIPIVFTLHDFWLFCHVGQLLKLDLTLCPGPVNAECSGCIPPKKALAGTYGRAVNILRKSGSILNSKFFQETLFKLFHRKFQKISGQLFRKSSPQFSQRNHHIRAMCSHVDLFIAPSNFICSKFVEFGISKDKIKYLPNGYNIERFRYFQKTKSSKIRFGYIGTFIRSKGIHVLIDAFKRINCERVELRIHGAPQNWDRKGTDYPTYLRSLGKGNNIRWFGEYDNDQIAGILSEIDVLIVPSIWYENAPLTIHEAFMASIPVITSDIGGMKELIRDGLNGLLFKTGSSKDLAKKMQIIIDNPIIVSKLQKGIKPVLPIGEHASKIRAIYLSLLSHKAGL